MGSPVFLSSFLHVQNVRTKQLRSYDWVFFLGGEVKTTLTLKGHWPYLVQVPKFAYVC